MKKKLVSLLVAVGIAAGVAPVSVFADGTEVWDGSIAKDFAGGTGTKDDPYEIATGAQLAYLGENVKSGTYGEKYANTYFELTEDIDLGGKEWAPIGETAADLIMGGQKYYVFSGNFDGNGHTIKNLTIGTEASPYSGDVCGLFGATSGTIEDVVLENVSIDYVGGKYSSAYSFRMAGALVGYSMGDIVDCTVIGLDMKAGSEGGYVAFNSIGGLVGIQDGEATISHSRASGKIAETTKQGNVGGFVGTLVSGSSAKYCGAEVSIDVTGTGRGSAVGGFVGIGNGETTDKTLIEKCYATGNITGAEYAGGFVGDLSGLNIDNCYATGDVSKSAVGASFLGTDAASYYYYGTVKNCYATGLVSDCSVSAYGFAMQSTMERSKFENCCYNAKNTANAAESALPYAIDDMKKSEFVDKLGGEAWIKRDNDTPACGAEPADYSKVDEALGKIPADLSVYTDESVANLNSAVAAVRRYKNLVHQADVDKMAEDVNNAVAALEAKPDEPVTSQPDIDESSDNSSDVSSSSAADSESSSSADSNTDSKSDSNAESKADSKSDSSSKAASNASNTNPSTGIAGGAFALALLSGVAVVMAKKKK